MVAVNPMLIWYSQEARGYALLVFFAALSFLFFLRALQTPRTETLLFGALASIGALTSHYSPFSGLGLRLSGCSIPLRSQWRRVAVAVGAIVLVGLALYFAPGRPNQSRTPRLDRT